jgi:hypothetical protein
MSAVEISGLNADIGFSTESDVALNEMYRSAYTVSHERKRVASRPPVVVLGRRERTQETGLFSAGVRRRHHRRYRRYRR